MTNARLWQVLLLGPLLVLVGLAGPETEIDMAPVQEQE